MQGLPLPMVPFTPFPLRLWCGGTGLPQAAKITFPPCSASLPWSRELGEGSFPWPGHEHWPGILVPPLGWDSVQRIG